MKLTNLLGYKTKSGLDSIPEARHYDVPRCEWCGEILDLTTAKVNEEEQLTIECHTCGELNFLT